MNAEQQTTPITPEKTHAMYDYKLHLTFKHKKPSLNVVVTHIGDKDRTVIYESHGDAFKVYVRVFTDEEISKRLNILKAKIKNKKKLSEIEVVDFAYILLFAQENKAKKYSQKVAKLFSEVKNLDLDLQIDIHYVLTKLIRLHFRDDETKIKELLTMITNALHPEAPDNRTTIEKMSQKVENMEEKLYQKNNEITEKNNEIAKKNNEIEKLKNKLKENNIEVD